MTPLLLAQIAGSDCEAFHEGLLDQPVNAWTSLVMVVAGLLIGDGGHGRLDRPRPPPHPSRMRR